jgi:tetratricopeptide (TPR) repeat protein
VPIDREATLKQADKLLKQGKLDAAIAGVRAPRSTSCRRTGRRSTRSATCTCGRATTRKAIEQYIRVADHQFAEGFFPKSAALYKKALKLDPDNEHILMQLAEIGERQGKFVDAKQFLKQGGQAAAGTRRGSRGRRVHPPARIAAGSRRRIEIAAVQAAQQLGDAFRAVELLKEAAQLLEKQKKRNEALQLLADAAEIDPFDAELRVRLAREFLELGQPKRARAYLSFDTAEMIPSCCWRWRQWSLRRARKKDARVAMARVLALAPDREPEIARIADSLMEESRVESAFACVDAVTDAALLQGDAPRAAAALQAFVERTPYIPALAKLAGISVEAGLGDRLRETQAQLVDAYLDASRGEDARTVAEDLVRAEPANEAHAERLRRALTLTGDPDPERALARVRAAKDRHTGGGTGGRSV